MNDKVVYFHKRNDTNEVFYVGIGKPKRPYHKYDRSGFWRKVVDKVGYTIEIVHEGLTWDEAVQYEVKYIKDFGRRNIGTGTLVNMTDGGEGTLGWVPSQETRDKISKANSGENNFMYGKKRSEETKRKIGIKQIGELNHRYGKQHTKEVLEQFSLQRRGEKNKASKLTKEQVLWIKDNYIARNKEVGRKPLSIKFNVSIRTIQRIVSGTYWKHLTI